MKNEAYVNKLILDSIPVDKKLKSWLISRYRKLCCYNGRAYACDVFKEARIVCKAYRADKDRLKKRDYYERKLPFRTSGWTKSILAQMDSNPQNMLQVLKLYVNDMPPVETVAEAAHRQVVYLQEIDRRSRDVIPVFTLEWIRHFVESKMPFPRKAFDACKHEFPERFIVKMKDGSLHLLEKQTHVLLHRFAAHHSYEEYVKYWYTWHSRLMNFKPISEYDALYDIRHRSVIPEMYKDYLPSQESSFQQLEDYFVVSTWISPEETPEPWREPCPLSSEGLDFLKSYLSHHHGNSDGEGGTWFPMMPFPLPFTYGKCVGQVHLIPKKGTVNRRPISVPNRFVQQGLAPCEHEMDTIIRRIPNDCTHDQGKFNTKIANRVNNPGLYVGSVDLSQATDNFPFHISQCLLDVIIRNKSCTTVQRSWDLFKEISRSSWLCGEEIAMWSVGQPLGTLPSFKAFALGHHILLESSSFGLGYGHSPYCIVGDDILFFNKKLRQWYIQLMDRRLSCPLSLHKSHEDNLVEFGGMTFIKNHTPVYTPDHRSITWESLFDYQRSARVSVSYPDLPKRYRRRIEKLVEHNSLPKGDAERVYNLASYSCMVEAFGPEDPRNRMNALLVPVYAILYAGEDRESPIPELTSGVQNIGGHPITLGDYGYANKDGHLLRYRNLKRPLPEWYETKFRPVSSDKRLQAAALVLKDTSVSLDVIKGLSTVG
jgi:hypothetical protein